MRNWELFSFMKLASCSKPNKVKFVISLEKVTGQKKLCLTLQTTTEIGTSLLGWCVVP